MAADSVAAFRVGYGLLATVGALRFLAKGWVDTLYLGPENHLRYAGFGWVEPLPPGWMHLHLVGLAVLGLCIAVGYRSRMAAALYVVGFGYTELIDATLYLNHYWFVTLSGVLIVILPVHGRFSVDVKSGRRPEVGWVPAWVSWSIRGQLAVVYLFAGIAKLNADWLFEAQPMALWLADRTHLPLVGSLLGTAAVAYAASWFGALFDLTIVFWLSRARTRRYAYAVVIGFHLTTGWLFAIGIFPWVMIVATLVFFPPDWPQRFGVKPTRHGNHARTPFSWVLLIAAMVQIVLPLRHYAEPGNVRWNEDGYYLSWRVMLTEKAGHGTFLVTDPDTATTWEVGPELVLADWQATPALVRPDLILATALLIEEYYGDEFGDLEIRADVRVSMNGRAAVPMIDPTVDLTSLDRGSGVEQFTLDPA